MFVRLKECTLVMLNLKPIINLWHVCNKLKFVCSLCTSVSRELKVPYGWLTCRVTREFEHELLDKPLLSLLDKALAGYSHSKVVCSHNIFTGGSPLADYNRISIWYYSKQPKIIAYWVRLVWSEVIRARKNVVGFGISFVTHEYL